MSVSSKVMPESSVARNDDVVWHTPRRNRPAARVRRYVFSALLWALGLLFLVPFAWMVSSSLKTNLEVFQIPVQWIPKDPQWSNYVEVWTGSKSIARYFLNSTIVAAVSVVGDVLTASMAGYAFARLSFKGRDKAFLIYLATTIIPFQLLLIPRFMLFRQLGLYNTLWALILPGIFTVFGTFLLRQFFVGVPSELGEAARIDGAGEWRVFWSVYLPLARPILAALAIIQFVGSWNNYESPLIMLSTDKHYTLPLGLTQFVDADGGLSAGLAMAASVSSVLPVFLVFLVFQRQFVDSMVHAGLRG
ncbi:carbohydrate ABC transporter permease [Aestuariimicrobium soli]|uniref:carbohydrate ABC transporter permease n=1 Tax=Aestuariimicrobium soli TaxID=2035834 RepID=UPI003EBE6178